MTLTRQLPAVINEHWIKLHKVNWVKPVSVWSRSQENHRAIIWHKLRPKQHLTTMKNRNLAQLTSEGMLDLHGSKDLETIIGNLCDLWCEDTISNSLPQLLLVPVWQRAAYGPVLLLPSPQGVRKALIDEESRIEQLKDSLKQLFRFSPDCKPLSDQLLAAAKEYQRWGGPS